MVLEGESDNNLELLAFEINNYFQSLIRKLHTYRDKGGYRRYLIEGAHKLIDNKQNEWLGWKDLEIEQSKLKELDISKIAKSSSKEDRQSKIAEARKTYPCAYLPWSSEEDEQLKLLYTTLSVDEISTKFERQSGAITARLKKLDLIK